MKKSILLLFLCFSTAMLIGQDKIAVSLQTGNALLLRTGEQFAGLPDRYYFGSDLSLHKKIHPTIALGITYETPAVKALGGEYYIMTDLSVGYKNYGRSFYSSIVISNDFYLPIRAKDKKMNTYLGVRNAFVIGDLIDRSSWNYDYYPLNGRHQFGAVVLFNYEINEKLRIGLNVYGDIKAPILDGITGGINTKYRTIETALKAMYQI